MEASELWTTSRRTSLRLVAYEGAGQSAPSVVMLHGLVTSSDVLREVVPGLDPYAALAGEGFNVLGLDWPGHGRSGGPRGHLSYRMAMDAAATAVKAARERWEGPVGLAGTALGGVLAFYAALEDTTGIGAVACHNVLDLRDVRPVLRRRRQATLLPAAALLRRRLRWQDQERVVMPVAAVLAPSDMANDPAIVRALRRHPQAVWRYDLAGLGSILLSPEDKPDVSAQRVPTLVAVGGADPILPEAQSRELLERLTCPTELWVLPGAGHQPLLENPRAAIPRIGGFLHRHLGPA